MYSVGASLISDNKALTQWLPRHELDGDAARLQLHILLLTNAVAAVVITIASPISRSVMPPCVVVVSFALICLDRWLDNGKGGGV